ncbi:UNVERIFIED_ORG: hypothetical protein JN05_00467 [Zoogloea ramigera]|uniref:Uncharacterized protein n=1 Tax=Duganella zoogloeoides TaxID=75659 RepID=A0ABZ0XTV8_9BURK|nr:hypothetical protein [Duganella zoogloeoides]WQH02666.1 hypothetical protein SR858_16455 [Duganella zoogloeoides]
MATEFDPFWLFKLPLSGDVMQRISLPWFSPTFNFAGDAGIEKRVVSEVASYGKQIGWLNELVIKLAEQQAVDADVLKKVKKAVEDINEIKKTQANTVLHTAVDALKQLEASEPQLYKELIKRCADDAASSGASH